MLHNIKPYTQTFTPLASIHAYIYGWIYVYIIYILAININKRNVEDSRLDSTANVRCTNHKNKRNDDCSLGEKRKNIYIIYMHIYTYIYTIMQTDRE